MTHLMADAGEGGDGSFAKAARTHITTKQHVLGHDLKLHFGIANTKHPRYTTYTSFKSAMKCRAFDGFCLIRHTGTRNRLDLDVFATTEWARAHPEAGIPEHRTRAPAMNPQPTNAAAAKEVRSEHADFPPPSSCAVWLTATLVQRDAIRSEARCSTCLARLHEGEC